MVQNLTGMIVAANLTGTTTNDLNYQALGVIIAASALIITLVVTLATVLYKNGQQVGEFRGIKQVIEAKFESLEEKYNTSEEIQLIELKIQTMESKIEMKSNKNDVNNHLSKLDEEIEALKKRGHLDWINSLLNINDIKNLIQEKGLLQNVLHYEKLGQPINLQKEDWSIKLKEYKLNKNVVPLEVDLVFGVSFENGITIKKDERTSHIDNIRIELFGNIIEDKLVINPNRSGFRWEEI
jgi:hypothetical protein